jgi:hypothetical protein
VVVVGTDACLDRLGQPVPIVIPARRSKAVWVTIARLEEKADLAKPIQARISTDDDHDFDSGPAVLKS